MGTNYSQDRRSDDNSPTTNATSNRDMPSYALAITRMDNSWLVTQLPNSCQKSFTTFVHALREQRAEGPLFGIFNYACEYFVIARPSPSGTKIFVSDIDAAYEEDSLIEALEERGYDTDVDDEDDSWAVGDFSILDDLGLPEPVLSIIVDNDETWADEQIIEIAAALGFEDELAAIIPTDH